MHGEDSPSPYRIITTLRRTERSVAAALEEALSAIDLTAAQFHVLEELTVTEVLHAGELAWRQRVTRQSMHGIVQNLAKVQLVELAPKEHGARNVWLTRGGRERFLQARERVSPIERRVGAAIAERDRGSLVRLLTDIGRSVQGTPREWWWD
jgi:DNA-binding MarR family transcriptional regulator